MMMKRTEIKENFNIDNYLVNYSENGKKLYLQVDARLNWFEIENEKYTIKVIDKIIDFDRGCAYIEVEVATEDRSVQGIGFCNSREFSSYIHTARTRALGDALTKLGYGTLKAINLCGHSYKENCYFEDQQVVNNNVSNKFTSKVSIVDNPIVNDDGVNMNILRDNERYTLKIEKQVYQDDLKAGMDIYISNARNEDGVIIINKNDGKYSTYEEVAALDTNATSKNNKTFSEKVRVITRAVTDRFYPDTICFKVSTTGNESYWLSISNDMYLDQIDYSNEIHIENALVEKDCLVINKSQGSYKLVEKTTEDLSEKEEIVNKDDNVDQKEEITSENNVSTEDNNNKDTNETDASTEDKEDTEKEFIDIDVKLNFDNIFNNGELQCILVDSKDSKNTWLAIPKEVLELKQDIPVLLDEARQEALGIKLENVSKIEAEEVFIVLNENSTIQLNSKEENKDDNSTIVEDKNEENEIIKDDDSIFEGSLEGVFSLYSQPALIKGYWEATLNPDIEGEHISLLERYDSIKLRAYDDELGKVLSGLPKDSLIKFSGKASKEKNDLIIEVLEKDGDSIIMLSDEINI